MGKAAVTTHHRSNAPRCSPRAHFLRSRILQQSTVSPRRVVSPMFHRSVRATSLLAFGSLLVTACGGGSPVSNASPRISEVPLQYTPGGSEFSLDLADFVTDREGSALTYAVTAGA